MTGTDLYNFFATLFDGGQAPISIDDFLARANVARSNREMARPWMRLRKLDSSQTASTSDTYTTPKNLPSDFMFLTKESYIVLFDGQQTWETYWEVPQYLHIQYKDLSQRFYIDHANQKFYLLGIVDRAYNIYIPYQADLGDITATTGWLNIPDRFARILAYDVASMYRLGTDYDDINARNADDNSRQADLLFKSMERWDDELQRSSVSALDYPTLGDQPEFVNRKIPIDNLM